MRKSLETSLIVLIWVAFTIVVSFMIGKYSKQLEYIAFQTTGKFFLENISLLIEKMRYLDHIECELIIPENLVNSTFIVENNKLILIKNNMIVEYKIDYPLSNENKFIINSIFLKIVLSKNNGTVYLYLSEIYQP